LAKSVIRQEDLDHTTEMIARSMNTIDNNEFAFWLLKARKQRLQLREIYEGYEVNSVVKSGKKQRHYGRN
jgi:hypothetical protein